MLILGEPGAGKTTLLLDLARELLTRAAGNPTHPVPVILNLSSWGMKKLPLTTWLIDQLQLVYSVPSRLSQAWLEQEQCLLLLDGLDEVEDEAQSKCIEAINAYRAAHFVPLVVCSRSQEYLAQEARLVLPSAVEIQPLDEQQVTEYLKQVPRDAQRDYIAEQ
jgi:predicted NACHT family NTPase